MYHDNPGILGPPQKDTFTPLGVWRGELLTMYKDAEV